MKRFIRLILFLIITPNLWTSAALMGTAFTYQGRLTDGGVVANGSYDFQFTLYDLPSAGEPASVTITNIGATVSNGLFTTTLDFDDSFNGTAYWLEIGVRTNGMLTDFVTLLPRQSIQGVPYALFSKTAGTANLATTAEFAKSVAATNLSGTIPESNLSTNVALQDWVKAHLSTNSLILADKNGIQFNTLGHPFAMITTDQIYNGVRDDTFKMAYNMAPGKQGGRINFNEPAFYLGMEANYYDGTNNLMELNVDYLSADGAHNRRGFGYGISRSTHRATWTFWSEIFALQNYAPQDGSIYEYFSVSPKNGVVFTAQADQVPKLIINSTSVGTYPGAYPSLIFSEAGQQAWAIQDQGANGSTLVVRSKTSQVMSMQQAGNVGIGEGIPYFPLDVGGSVRIQSQGKLLFGGTKQSDADVALYKSAAGTLKTDGDLEVAGAVKVGSGALWTSGVGNPEGNVAGNVGSLYTRTDGGPGSTLFVKEVGSGNTGWVAK